MGDYYLFEILELNFKELEMLIFQKSKLVSGDCCTVNLKLTYQHGRINNVFCTEQKIPLSWKPLVKKIQSELCILH
jgi:hypothetical protein